MMLGTKVVTVEEAINVGWGKERENPVGVDWNWRYQ